MLSFKDYLEEKSLSGCDCWKNYKRVPGTKPCSKGSCVKEETVDEDTYQGKEVKLNKLMAGDVKKSKVYVDLDGDGKAW